jgi:hypothetical protein
MSDLLEGQSAADGGNTGSFSHSANGTKYVLQTKNGVGVRHSRYPGISRGGVKEQICTNAS